MRNIKYYGKKQGRKIEFNDQDKFYLGEYLKNLEDGTDLEMTVKKKYKKRTSGQPGEETNFNGYLWGVVYKIIGDEIGENDLDYIHYWAQIKVGNVKILSDGTPVPAGTRFKSGGKFSEYCSKVRMWAGTPGNIVEHGLYIPEPNEDVNFN